MNRINLLHGPAGRLISGVIFSIKVVMTIFDEEYKVVVAVESQHLVIRGVLTGNVLVINTVPEFPLREEAFPVGQLITLSDPAERRPRQKQQIHLLLCARINGVFFEPAQSEV